MPYKTILVHADHSRHAEARLKAATAVAADCNAHLVGAAMSGLSRYIYQDGGTDLMQTVLASHMEELNRRANAALDHFERLAAGAAVRSFERRLVDDEPGAALALQARYADLVVVSQSDPDDPVARMTPGLPEYVMLASARPVLVVPHAGHFPVIGSEVLVAWDASTAATRALANALPLLKRARRVTVAVFNPDDAHGQQPGADIALYLARHGINAEVMAQRTSIDVGEALLSLAADVDTNLIVMGCYGHARVRELLLGGVTATILKSMTAPVLMSH
ncbi:universal stress protein [Massilia antarctica]|uniref:universal stress protein n=1 Tax=Massilia antarctica TaxID=2765360 RepID=UPI0006BB74A2|nr:universal stress protein [Massilia sp. H27-R4]MCY0910604.1 universal stress protein [Massilia sp. H27-R4]CUI09032.1 Universal stress protein UspA and related nucleotide-binding proteins [Janthinobacterium sp. CG23_2]CUU32818.1 Universal stress protein UspA and related nucleotide-binding proteins [Janthinobacterium sp. CG23_2]